jgi:hypothetical protein
MDCLDCQVQKCGRENYICKYSVKCECGGDMVFWSKNENEGVGYTFREVTIRCKKCSAIKRKDLSDNEWR